MPLTKQYREYLPGPYQKAPGASEDFLGRFLAVFENLMSEMDSVPPSPQPLPNEGLEQILDRVHEFFDPYLTTSKAGSAVRNFLDWLAEWTGLLGKTLYGEVEKRRIIARIIPLYKRRGTKSGIKDILEAFMGRETVSVLDTGDELQSFADAYFGGDTNEFIKNDNYTFCVVIDLRSRSKAAMFGDPDTAREMIEFINRVVEREKPADTDAVIMILSRNAMQIAVVCTIRVDTYLGYGPAVLRSVDGVIL